MPVCKKQENRNDANGTRTKGLGLKGKFSTRDRYFRIYAEIKLSQRTSRDLGVFVRKLASTSKYG